MFALPTRYVNLIFATPRMFFNVYMILLRPLDNDTLNSYTRSEARCYDEH